RESSASPLAETTRPQVPVPSPPPRPTLVVIVTLFSENSTHPERWEILPRRAYPAKITQAFMVVRSPLAWADVGRTAHRRVASVRARSRRPLRALLHRVCRGAAKGARGQSEQ